MADQDLDRNEEATPHRLQKARERGQVARSADVVSAVVFSIAVACLYWKGGDGLQSLFRLAQALLAQAGQLDGSAASLWWLLGGMVRDAGSALAPFLIALIIAAVVANLAQTGPVFSVEPVKPDFSRLNPVTGLKKLFSMRTLFDGVRAVLKLLLLTLVVYQSIKSLAPQFAQLASMPSAQLAHTVLDDAAATGLKVALMLCLIALVDFGYTRREYSKKMRMSRRDLKDEHKNREGDPRIRSRLRELRREALRRSMAARQTSSADVLLTNPTHVAVALRYVHGEMASPQLVAKGAGALAAGMRMIAAKHGIPVVQNPPLARQLFRELEVDQHVPPNLYAQVAKILVWIFAMREARSAGARA